MGQSVSQKRPWLAALLAALATGLGHLYLRRWRRALGWLGASIVVSYLFVDQSAVDEVIAGTMNVGTLLAVSPMFLVVGLSIVDAYVLAHTQNVAARSSDTRDEDTSSCPHCGNELDPDLEFCHWCTKSVEDVGQDQVDAPDDT
ncbi:zinc ribbon domain-containing protein (plasmid) [Natrinema zhouii]|uniref:zinc ribbon domain-containing protein n=1 Tax=Natrinema zhouii TaxID=1710539 RepID=UPI001CFF9FCE|nr:zinc ribbon domain-containing protein [Natrinema zhouii]UHQ98999.1 zinc ribbon domain-containing protein [Natrinema zhouii]